MPEEEAKVIPLRTGVDEMVADLIITRDANGG